MKVTPIVLAILVSSSALASQPKLDPYCEATVRAAVAALDDGAYVDEKTGAVTISKEELAAVQISNVKIIDSACVGPSDCDAQHPDAFTYGADIGKKGNGVVGKIVVHAHRGNCYVRRVSLSQ